MRAWSSCILALLVLGVPLAAQKELLRDGDFEKAGKKSSPAWTHVHPPALRPAPEFAYPAQDVHGGKRCAEVRVEYMGGFTSFTQEVDLPRKVDWLRFSGWARVDPAGGGGSAWLVLAFIGKDSSDSDLRQSRRLGPTGTWEELVLEAAVPEGTTRVMVRCGVFGPARARFDDVALLGGEGQGARDEVTLVETHGHWRVEAPAAVARPTLDVSVPFPFAAQTPLALRVESDPPGRVARLVALAEGVNRPLRIELAPLDAGEVVELDVRTLVLVRRRELSSGEDVELPAASRVPAEVRPFLRAAAGIESEDERIRALARGFERRDLARLARSLLDYLAREIAPGGGDQGALATLESRDAACTGHANMGAALMIAAGVPTRVLACLLVGHEQEEHYLIESWTKTLGWARIETAIKLFPVPDALHVILRVVEPDAPRSSENVPLFWRLGEGLTGGYDPGPLGKGLAWQSARELAQRTLDAGSGTAAESAARAAFEELVRTPHSGATIRLAPSGCAPEMEAAVASFLGG